MTGPINLAGKVALVTGVADDVGFGWHIAKALQAAGEGHPVKLSLCGERQACTLTPRPLTVWQRLRQAWRPPSRAVVDRLLEVL